MRILKLFIAVSTLILGLVSCGRGEPVGIQVVEPMVGAGQIGYSSSHELLGLYKLSISADRSEVAIVPDRAGMLHLNALRLLEVDPCTDCVSIESVETMGQNRVQVTIELTHPYSAEYPKLTAFDVRGIVMLPGSYEFPGSGITVPREDLGDAVLVGPDGYTRLFNPLEFPEDGPGPPALKYFKGNFAVPDLNAGTLNPYLLFAEYTERNHFAPNTSHSRTFDLKLQPGPIELGYAVDVSWYPVDGPVDTIPDDFPISANSLEAYRMWVSIGKGLTPTGSGQAKVRVEVFDWQGVDSIDQVLITAPDLFDGDVEAAYSIATDEGFVFEAYIQNSLQAPIGDYPLLLTVKDKEPDPNLGLVAAYQLVDAHVTLTGVWIRELVYIPAGDFIMGGDPAVDPQVNAGLGETPQHIHTTSDYYIGKYEISNEEYAAFMADGGYSNPVYWSADGWDWKESLGLTQPVAWGCKSMGYHMPDYPTYSIGWFEAEAFCNWAGGRLPTEAEWEKAARGTDGRIFPWGNEWDPTKCWNNKSGWGPALVYAFSPEGDSPYGVANTIGNAMEWGADWFNNDIYDQYATGDFTPPTDPTIPDTKIARGGSLSMKYIDGYFRTSARRPGSLHSGSTGIGFRIVFDP